MKVLLLAYACEPGRGSEPGVGWHWAQNLAPHAEIHVLTRANNEAAIIAAMATIPAQISFHYHDLGRYTRMIKRVIGVQAYHQLWHITALRLIKRLQAENEFDLIHHLTFGVAWGVSPAWIVARRFIWGPFGGGDIAPAVITRSWPLRPRLAESVRRLFVMAAFRLNPLAWLAFSQADMLFARTHATYAAIPERYRHKARVLLETGAPDVPEAPDSARIAAKAEMLSQELRLVTVGRLIPLKYTELALHTLAELGKRGYRPILNILGTGPQSMELSALAVRLGIADQVSLAGQLAREQVFEQLNQAHVLLHPSVREGGAWSIFEALAMGLPVICLDNAGPGAIVDGDSGVKLTPTTSDAMARSMADAVIAMTADPTTWTRHANAARRRAITGLSWHAITETVLADWHRVVADERA
ncbi:MAG: glycosyltransferase [Candidatus Accumulibacter sp.]|jgi:glycosyltransferase involved in cell wall biosynthesis|uniref:Glycosyltransferase n=1 Tax=Candidatus Accumulibacter proximus TaxID=2954385 RepID=A0A935PVH7_9PROT|nr:glycosyltransferase [Candidatus Accumulibacter proximus]